jgi:predicted alpha/beta-fold hydrolase
MGLFGILLLLLLALIIFCVYRCVVSYKPKVFMNPEKNVQPILAKMKTLGLRYRPTPWLVGGHAFSVWGLRFRPAPNKADEREKIIFEDGGEAFLDWFNPEGAKRETPIVVIIHTLGGGTREPCTNNFAGSVRRHGWRAVVANCRGCSGAQIKSNRLYNAYQTDDIEFVLNHIPQKGLAPEFTFMVGFSLGAMQVAQCAVKELKVDAYGLISHTYDPLQCSDILEKPIQRFLYLKVIVAKLCHCLRKNVFREEKYNDALLSTTLREFDDKYTALVLGFDNHVEYYKRLYLRDKVGAFKAPSLILGSDDDPFTLPDFQPKREVANSDNVAMIIYPEGGHVSLASGFSGGSSRIDTLVLDWFDAVIKNKNA